MMMMMILNSNTEKASVKKAGQEEKACRKHESVQSQSFPWDRSRFHLLMLEECLVMLVP